MKRISMVKTWNKLVSFSGIGKRQRFLQGICYLPASSWRILVCFHPPLTYGLCCHSELPRICRSLLLISHAVMLVWANISLRHSRGMKAATRISSLPRALSRSKAPTAFLSLKTMCKSLYVSFTASSFYYQHPHAVPPSCSGKADRSALSPAPDPCLSHSFPK